MKKNLFVYSPIIFPAPHNKIISVFNAKKIFKNIKRTKNKSYDYICKNLECKKNNLFWYDCKDYLDNCFKILKKLNYDIDPL